ncbi:MAG: hypothetical protein ACI39R_03565 [Lachnospiraceae bacterium]
METGKYIRLARCSKILLSWFTIYSAIIAYLNFSDVSIENKIVITAIYFLCCGIYILIRWKQFTKQLMSYIMHPMFYFAVALGFFITLIENNGSNSDIQGVLLILVLTGALINYYLSSFAINVSNASPGKADVMIKHSGRQHAIFAIWLLFFLLAAFLILFVPASGIGKSLFTFSTKQATQTTEDFSPLEIDEEEIGQGMADERNTGGMFAVVLGICIVLFVVLIVIIARKIFYANAKKPKYEPEGTDEIKEEVFSLKNEKDKKKPKEKMPSGATAKIRRYFYKTVKFYYPGKVDSAKTPKQLLCTGRNEEKELNELYETVRYSTKEGTGENASRAGELYKNITKR